MTNIRECNICHKQVDFDEPWCDHETMEESAWLDIKSRIVIDDAVYHAALDMSYTGGQNLRKLMLDCGMTEQEVDEVIKEAFEWLHSGEEECS